MSSNKYILGVDTSHSRGQLCLLKDNVLIENLFWEKKGSHSEKLNYFFEQMCTKYQILFEQIQKIYCSIGPGSFTGLRVGLNFCKTLSYAHKIDLIPVNTLLSLAHLCTNNDKPILSVIDAQRNAVFISIFTFDKNCTSENQVISIKDLNNLIDTEHSVCGIGLERYREFLDNNFLKLISSQKKWELPDITPLIEANEKQNFLNSMVWSQISPLYIRLSAAEEKRNSLLD